MITYEKKTRVNSRVCNNFCHCHRHGPGGGQRTLQPQQRSCVRLTSANDSSGVVAVSANTTVNQLQQMQELITQYQQREKQYQQREQQYQQQLNDANTQIQEYQSLLQQMQAIGLIRIGPNGQISVPRRFGD